LGGDGSEVEGSLTILVVFLIASVTSSMLDTGYWMLDARFPDKQ